MSRLDLLTIAIVIVCLAALGYLVYKIVNLMNPPEESPTTSITDTYSDPANSEDTYTYDEEADSASTNYDDSDLDDDELDNYNSEDNYDASGSRIDESEMDNESTGIAETGTHTTTAPATTTTTSTSSRSSNSSGRYMVIAGTYKQKINAENQVNKLKRLGYSNAQIELFDRGSYAIVLVDRHDSESAAQTMVGQLRKEGIDSYIKLKQ